MQIQMEMEHQDGIIFADFKNGGSGSWGTTYTISTVTGLKEYYVSKTNYNGSFGIKDVLSARRSGNARFNVMAFSSNGNHINKSPVRLVRTFWFCEKIRNKKMRYVNNLK